MFQLQIHLKNHLQPYSLNYNDERTAKELFMMITNRRKNKLQELVVIDDDYNGALCVDCTEVSTHGVINTETLIKINAENQVMGQVFANKAALREASKPQIQPASGLVS